MTQSNKLNTTPSPEAIKQSEQKIAENANFISTENILNTIFQDKFTKNTDFEEVRLKVCVLNEFYNTYIRATSTVAEHIRSLNIDARLAAGDAALVNEIACVAMREKTMRFYSFASKYCSFHQPEKYAIYDRYVYKVLMDFKRRDKFASFKSDDLKNYPVFLEIVKDFQRFYGLENFSLKQIDKYLWQLGIQEFAKPAAAKSRAIKGKK